MCPGSVNQLFMTGWLADDRGYTTRVGRIFHHHIHMCLLLFSSSVVSDSLRPHGPQHTRLPCPSPSPGASSNSRPVSRWCYPTTSSSVALLLQPSVFPNITGFTIHTYFLFFSKCLHAISSLDQSSTRATYFSLWLEYCLSLYPTFSFFNIYLFVWSGSSLCHVGS